MPRDRSASMNDKIIELETTLAHHEQKLDELSELVTDQWKQIELLKRALTKAEDKIDQMAYDKKDGGGSESGSSMDDLRAERPPHY